MNFEYKNSRQPFFQQNSQQSRQSSKYQRCPYNKKHKIQNRNFAQHIQKCKNSMNPSYVKKFVACKYNSMHIFHSYQIGAHEMSCPNRKTMLMLEQKLLADEIKIMNEQLSESVTSANSSRCIKDKTQQPVHQYKQKYQILQPQPNNHLQKCYALEGKPKKSRTFQYGQQYFIKEANNYNNQSCIEIKSEQSSVRQQCSQNQQTITMKKKKDRKNKYKLDAQPNNLQINHQNKLLQQKQCSKQKQKGKNKQNNDFSLYKNLYNKPEKSPNQIKQTNNKQKQLDDCQLCSQVLCDPRAKLWRNKKLVKLLKSYAKLQQQHEQIKEYLKNIQNIMKKPSKSAQKTCKQTNNCMRQYGKLSLSPQKPFKSKEKNKLDLSLQKPGTGKSKLKNKSTVLKNIHIQVTRPKNISVKQLMKQSSFLYFADELSRSQFSSKTERSIKRKHSSILSNIGKRNTQVIQIDIAQANSMLDDQNNNAKQIVGQSLQKQWLKMKSKNANLLSSIEEDQNKKRKESKSKQTNCQILIDENSMVVDDQLDRTHF